MNSAEKEAVLHCLKVTIDEALCEDCPLYGTTGTYLCEKDCARLAINALEQEPCTDAISRQAVLEAIEDDNRNAHYSCFASNYDAQCFKDIIKELPPVTPQYTDAEIQKMQDLEFAEIQKAYEIGKAENPNKWIPVSERLPEDLEPVNITWVNHEPEPYYHDIKDKNFVATGIHYRGQWYWYSTTCADYLGEYGSNDIDKVDDAVEIVAWMPLPEPYKASPTDEEDK